MGSATSSSVRATSTSSFSFDYKQNLKLTKDSVNNKQIHEFNAIVLALITSPVRSLLTFFIIGLSGYHSTNASMVYGNKISIDVVELASHANIY